MDNSAQIMWGMFFGAIGMGFFVFGRKQRSVVPLLTGIALFIFPYFITNSYLMVIVGAAIIAVPYFVRI